MSPQRRATVIRLASAESLPRPVPCPGVLIVQQPYKDAILELRHYASAGREAQHAISTESSAEVVNLRHLVDGHEDGQLARVLVRGRS